MSQLFDTSPLDAPVAFAKVALEQGIDVSDGLTYGVPASLGDLAVGERVSVPLGRGNKASTGYVMAISEDCDLPANKRHLIKSIVARDESGVSLSADLVELAQWMAGYYCCPLGMVFATMLPAAVKHGTGRVKREMVGIDSSKFQVPSSKLEEGEVSSSKFQVPGSKLEEAEVSSSKLQVPGSELENLEPGPCNLELSSLKLTKLQKSIVAAALAQREAGVLFTEIRELADLAGAKTVSPVRQLIAKGVLTTQTQAAVRASPAFALEDRDPQGSGIAGLALTGDQDRAVREITTRLGAGFSVTLLHGVTGSGKTEVYLCAIEAMKKMSSKLQVPSSKSANLEPGTWNLEPSPAALVLVPEIALTPQTVARFQRRFGQVALLHSGLTAAQRHEQWRRIRRGEVNIVVGARSAIFAPLTGIGIIIVDEEHESSYKQDQLPRYHARDVAIKRGQILNIPVLLGSATPSLESYFNAGGGNGSKFQVPSSKLPKETGDTTAQLGTWNLEPGTIVLPRSRFHLLRLPTRVPGLALPKVEIVDLSQERRKRYEYTGKAGVHLVSLRLEAAIRKTMEAKRQTLILLNRRGYANYIACPDHKCGWLLQCDYCDVTMVFHKDATLPTGGYVHCHHCTAKQLLPELCPVCSKKVTVFGLGTQRVEEELAKKFPGIRMIRMDSDSMRTARDYVESLDQFRAGLIDVLLGTQMIAKGLDFPNVELVGVISADTSLHMPDFRAAERTFQLIAQVAGRAGRGSDPGTVIVQTFNPQDPAITLASRHDYDTFAANELKLRGEMGLPPVTRMARIVVRDKDHVDCYEYAKNLAAHLNASNDEMNLGIRIRGPVACPIARIAEFHRLQIELIAKDAATLQKLIAALRNARLLKSDNHVAVDVDPVALM